MEKSRFTQFYRANVTRIYKFVYFRVNGCKELAQDLTQDIFIKVFEAFDRYDPLISQSSWLFTIARNHLINQHAKTRPGVSLEDVEGTLWASQDFRQRFARNFDERKLMEAIAKLSAEDAQLVRMKYLEGWPFEDLAEMLGKSSGALRVQATRALKKLRSLLKNPNS